MAAALALANLAAEQWGLVTTAQARALGVSPQTVTRLASQGSIERVAHGVYRVAGAPPAPLDGLRAAWLVLEPGRPARERLREEVPIVISHRSAAAVHELGNLEADEFEFTSGSRKQTRRPDTRFHRLKVQPGDWTVVDGLPVTTVVRTVDDLAAARLDGGHLASVVRDSLTRTHVDDRQIVAVLRRHAHHYGARLGDGEALLQLFLQESGVPEPIGRAVDLSRPRLDLDVLAQLVRTFGDLPQLQEQLAAVQRLAANPGWLGELVRVQEAAIRRPAELQPDAAAMTQARRGSVPPESTKDEPSENGP